MNIFYMEFTVFKPVFRLLAFVLAGFVSLCGFCAEKSVNSGGAVVVEAEISGEISKPQVYILKRAIKEAESLNARALIINMDTPGGGLGAMLEMMELISASKLRTVCYVNPNAVSAGAYVAFACDEIWFSPTGVMGAAESVLADGGDVPKSMKRKIESFLSAKTKAVSGGGKNRPLVQRAMSEPDFELKIGGNVLKKKGELMSLTADDAVKIYDKTPLLANGVANSAEEIAQKICGLETPVKIERIGLTAFEKISKYIVSFSSVMMGIGMFFLFLELKTSGFGVLGIIGAGVLFLVFLGSNMAGLAGYEAAVLFAVGIIFVLLEIFLFTGTLVCAFLGIAMILASLVAAGVSLPEGSWIPDSSALVSSVWKSVFSIALAFALLAAFGGFFKTTSLWKKFVLEGGLGMGRNSDNRKEAEEDLIGSCGTAFTDMAPNGKVEVNGKVYDASNSEGAFVKKGSEIVVVERSSFELKVKSKK